MRSAVQARLSLLKDLHDDAGLFCFKLKTRFPIIHPSPNNKKGPQVYNLRSSQTY